MSGLNLNLSPPDDLRDPRRAGIRAGDVGWGWGWRDLCVRFRCSGTLLGYHLGDHPEIANC